MRVDAKVEKWCKIVHFVFMRIVLYGVTVPKVIFCFYVYYTTDLGTEAFEMPFPFWYEFFLDL